MLLFILSLICFLVFIGAAIGVVVAKDKFGPGVTATVTLVLGVVFLLSSMYAKVDTRHVGVVVSYGKPTGEVTGAGIHWTKPWESIDDSWDATRQPYDHLTDACTDPQKRDGLWVTIAGQRNACIRVQVNWEIAPIDTKAQQNHAAQTWGQYQPRKINGDSLNRFQAFEYSQVVPSLNSAVGATFRTFDPLALVDKATGEAQAPDLAGTYTEKLTQNIKALLGDDIVVKGIAWGPIGYDGTTTALIAGRAQKVLESRNLEIDKTNADLRSKIAGTSGVPAAVQQCLDLVKALNKGEPGLCMGGQVALTKPIGG